MEFLRPRRLIVAGAIISLSICTYLIILSTPDLTTREFRWDSFHWEDSFNWEKWDLLGWNSEGLIESHESSQLECTGNEDLWPYRSFRTAPWTPPELKVQYQKTDANLSEGYLFLNPMNFTGQCVQHFNPFIISQENNELIYAVDESLPTSNFRVQTMSGKPHLTYWRGRGDPGHAYGELVILNEEYHEKVIGLNHTDLEFVQNNQDWQNPPGSMDFHEQEATSDNTVLVTAYNITSANLSTMHGPEEGWILDSQFYEIDIKTSEIKFKWSAKDHIPIEDSKLPISSGLGDGTRDRPYDYFHINSVQQIGDNFLIGARHIWGVWLISRTDGHVIWKLDGSGEGGDFGPLEERGQFRWSSHAKAYDVRANEITISVFDNHAISFENKTAPARGIMLRLQLPADKAVSPKVLSIIGGENTSDTDLYALSQGSYQPDLDNGHQLMSYGSSPVIREFGPGVDGPELLWEARFGLGDAQNYRVHKHAWNATPSAWDPTLVIEPASSTGTGTAVKGYVSWNGATDIEAWNIYTGTVRGSKKEEDENDEEEKGDGMKLVGKALKKGFETSFELTLGEKSRCVQAAAVRYDEEIRRSQVLCRPGS